MSTKISPVQAIAVADLASWQENVGPHALIDVRERGEYILGHIPGATNIPRGRIEIRLLELISSLTVPIVLYCDDSYRSTLAAASARALGYTSVRILDGGLQNWSSGDRAVAYGVNVIGKDYGERIAVERGIRQITPEDLGALRAHKNVMVLDVRTPHEFEHEGHLDGAHNVPGGEIAVAVLKQLQGSAPPDEIVVNCAGRTRSIVAADLLTSLGIGNVQTLENGTMAWIMAGRPLEMGGDKAPIHTSDELARQRAGELALRTAQDQGLPGLDAKALSTALEDEEFLYVLDVRTPAEYERERIAGAVSCPLGQLTNYLDDTVVVRQAPIVCYSNDQTRAIFAARTLTGIGYPNVRWLAGGLVAWNAEAGRTLEGPASQPGLDAAWRNHGASSITGDELAIRGENEPSRIIDIRQSSDFMFGHVPGSTWVPRGDLERRISDVATGDEEVILVADHPLLAGLATETLHRLGYSQVRVLQGGFAAWKSGGNPVVEGSDGSDINLLAAREEADLVGFGPSELRRTEEDMVRYLDWEQQLGEKYMSGSPADNPGAGATLA